MATVIGTERGHVPVVMGDDVRIPAWVVDLESFRRWARSEEFPEHGSFSYLDGELWVDVSMEELFPHNQVKTEFTVVVGGLVRDDQSDYFCADRMRLTNPAVNLSTEPDGLFAFWDTVQTRRLRLIPGAAGGYVELEGRPDMVLEIISRGFVRKDMVVLRDLYWRTGVAEYWLVDARAEVPRFDILRHTARGFVNVRKQGGWIKSSVFGKAFRLERQTDPLGHPRFTLAVR